MRIDQQQIADINASYKDQHNQSFGPLQENLSGRGLDIDQLIDKIHKLQIAIPSWALGAGGTRFGRFPIGGEPGTLEQKIDDVGLLHALNRSSGSISLHIPWDIPDDPEGIKERAAQHDIVFDAVNSNTFQDQPDQEYSYKFGSLSHTKQEVRQQAIEHNIEVINHGETLGSKALTVWLADGSSFPGQQNFQRAFRNTLESLQKIYKALPPDWKILVEYKPYEPNFYSMVMQDWGSSLLFSKKLGDQAYSLVDLGHHLPNTNIEQIVALLFMQEKLGGFHFNDSKYGDDDLTVGAIKPYQLFLIFNQLVQGMEDEQSANPPLSWMIDASHNIKDPLEDLLQSVEAINLAYAQALIIDRQQLTAAQEDNDPALAQEILQDAFRTDLRPLLRECRLRNGAAIEPVQAYRELDIRQQLINERGTDTVATGL